MTAPRPRRAEVVADLVDARALIARARADLIGQHCPDLAYVVARAEAMLGHALDEYRESGREIAWR